MPRPWRMPYSPRSSSRPLEAKAGRQSWRLKLEAKAGSYCWKPKLRAQSWKPKAGSPKLKAKVGSPSLKLTLEEAKTKAERTSGMWDPYSTTVGTARRTFLPFLFCHQNCPLARNQDTKTDPYQHPAREVGAGAVDP